LALLSEDFEFKKDFVILMVKSGIVRSFTAFAGKHGHELSLGLVEVGAELLNLLPVCDGSQAKNSGLGCRG
jgi:hypothetical protein